MNIPSIPEMSKSLPITCSFPFPPPPREEPAFQHPTGAEPLARTGVGAQVGFEVGTLEVGFLAAGEVTHVIPPPGEVHLGGTGLARSDEHGSRGEGQELGAAHGHQGLRARRCLRDSGLWQNQHDSPLRHRGAHEHRLGERGCLGQYGLHGS